MAELTSAIIIKDTVTHFVALTTIYILTVHIFNSLSFTVHSFRAVTVLSVVKNIELHKICSCNWSNINIDRSIQHEK